MHRTLSVIAAAIIILFTAAGAFAYQAALDASASKTTVSKGEGFTYKLSVIEEGQADRPIRQEPPDFTGFNVSGTFSSTSVKVINNQARTVTDQEYRLSSGIPGEHVIGPARLVLTDPKTGKEEVMTSNPVKVMVLEKSPGILKGMEDEIKDIKGPVTFLDKVRLFFYGLIGFGAVVLFGLLALAWYMVKRGRKKAAPQVETPVTQTGNALSARDKALLELKRAEPLRGDTKAFYSAVSGAVKGYLEAAKGIPATFATTSEIISGAGKAGLPEMSRIRLRALLEEADLVKFARHFPEDEEKARFIESARRLVVEI